MIICSKCMGGPVRICSAGVGRCGEACDEYSYTVRKVSALCNVKFRQIEEHGRTLHHLQLKQ